MGQVKAADVHMAAYVVDALDVCKVVIDKIFRLFVGFVCFKVTFVVVGEDPQDMRKEDLYDAAGDFVVEIQLSVCFVNKVRKKQLKEFGVVFCVDNRTGVLREQIIVLQIFQFDIAYAEKVERKLFSRLVVRQMRVEDKQVACTDRNGFLVNKNRTFAAAYKQDLQKIVFVLLLFPRFGALEFAYV